MADLVIALAALTGFGTGLIAGALWRREKTADAEYDRDAMFIRVLAAEKRHRDALPTDKWAELTGAPTVAVDAEFDALADALWVRR